MLRGIDLRATGLAVVEIIGVSDRVSACPRQLGLHLAGNLASLILRDSSFHAIRGNSEGTLLRLRSMVCTILVMLLLLLGGLGTGCGLVLSVNCVGGRCSISGVR